MSSSFVHDQNDKRVQVIKENIRTIPHWPQQGIMFRDITTYLQHAESYRYSIDILHERYKDMKIEVVAGLESRGFILGAPLAYLLGAAFVPIRKPNKLPAKTISATYMKEYGPDTMQVHEDAVKKGQRVVLIDDLIATGGTLAAGCELLEKLGANIVELACVIELPELGGRAKLPNYKLFTMLTYEGH